MTRRYPISTKNGIDSWVRFCGFPFRIAWNPGPERGTQDPNGEPGTWNPGTSPVTFPVTPPGYLGVMMSESHVNPSPANVVDLASYRARRTERPLPLFDGLPDPKPAPAPGTRIVVALSARQAAHRARMLRHLVGGAGARARQDV
jgi:hypothetical protein